MQTKDTVTDHGLIAFIFDPIHDIGILISMQLFRDFDVLHQIPSDQSIMSAAS